ncbi:gluconokinase [Albirhodobacter sp. R86504]|uniref:gluconokinase n=1 Tax=Albirhodobacter sp. R86504 TaxID=3093848 RepID=UPI00366BF84C
MGVSGCGKSTIAELLAARIGGVFVDGDALHPQANIDKMARGEPLDDADRLPWLRRVGGVFRRGAAEDAAELSAPCVIACSALKRRYRDLIAAEAGGRVEFLYLQGSRDVLLRRMAQRTRHFMPLSLLDSQLASLEEPAPDETAVTLSVDLTPEQIVAAFLASLQG